MKTNVTLILIMVACMVLDAHTATLSYFTGQIGNMWSAIGAGVLCSICFIGNLMSLVKMAKGKYERDY